MEEFKTLSNVCVIIPVYKSKDKINIVLKKILKLKPELVILVDDNCPQKSLNKIKFKIKKVVKIIHKSNKGVGGAFISGVKFLKDKNFRNIKFISKLDSDDQHDPSDLLIMKKKIYDQKADFVKGNRFLLMRRPKKMSLIRRVGNIGLTFLYKLATGQWELSDPVNGIFLGRSKVIIDLLRFDIKERYLFESSLLFNLSKLKAKLIEIPVNISYSNEISSLKWYKEIIPFFSYYIKGFLNRIFREYLYPDLNPGILPLMSFFVFLILLIKKTFLLFDNMNEEILSEVGDINLFVVYLIACLFSFFIWLLFDTSKNSKNISIHDFYK